MKKRSAGISAVVGTAIGLMIFFTVVIPMWIYMQNLQTLFMDEVSKRMRFEIEKVNEKLDVVASLQPPELHPFQRSRLFIYVTNKSPVEVSVPVIYIESNKIGLQRIDKVLKLAPGERIQQPVLDYVLEPDEVVVVRLPTLRGNSFSTESIGPLRLPNLMVVQITNASFGYWYQISVDVFSTGDVNKVVGCVAMSTDEFATGCKTAASTWRYVSSPDDLTLLAGFAVAPGTYEVKVTQCRMYGGGDCSDVLPEPTRVEVMSNMVVEVKSSAGPVVTRPIPLRVTPLLPMYTYVVNATTSTSMFPVPFVVYLGNNTEPLFNVKISVDLVRQDNLTASIATPSFVIARLSPDESYFGTFLVKVVDENDNRSFGGYFVYRIALTEATGQITRRTYSTADFQAPSAEAVTVLCRWWINRGVTITSCRAP